MLAEVIAIGDELTSGQRLDTNSQWLSERLGEVGLRVAFHTTVGDHLEENIHVFREAIDRADVVIATGGLGPTADDLTREALAAAVGVGLVEDADALAHIRNLFARRSRAMPERNKLQALIPKGGRLIRNEEGTAPGIDLTVLRAGCSPCRVFCLPGVPAEMFAMWNESVKPAICEARPSQRVICHRRIKCFGLGESELEALIPEVIRRKREPLVGITVQAATITLRITASGADTASARKAMDPTIAEIHERLGNIVFGEEDDELEHAVVRLLMERKKTLAVAEWGTDGLVSTWLATAAGTSEVFLGSLVGCGQHGPPGLPGNWALPRTAPTAEMACSWARSVQSATGANLGLSVVGIPAVETSSLGTLLVGLATDDDVVAKEFTGSTHPSIAKPRSAKQALNTLRMAILERCDD